MANKVKALLDYRRREGEAAGLDRALTFEEAGARVGVNKATWHGWETGKKVPAPKFMRPLCDLVGASSDIFYPALATEQPKRAPASDGQLQLV